MRFQNGGEHQKPWPERGNSLLSGHQKSPPMADFFVKPEQPGGISWE
jgi:hypothetical protein